MRSQSVAYRPDIDGLRALAVLLVVGYHAFPGKLPGGHIGVDVFFTISGYLISTIILNDLQRGTFSYLDFYLRRCRRIFPALIAVLVGTWAIAWFVLTSPEYVSFGAYLISGAAFVANLHLWTEVGYFDGPAKLKPLLHLWSLGIEEQFYLASPAVLLILHRLRALTIGIALLVFASFLTNIILTGTDPSSAFYLLPGRFWELMAGAALDYFHHRRPVAVHPPDPKAGLSSLTPPIATVLALGAIFALAIFFNHNIPYPGWFALIPILASVILIHCGSANGISSALLSNKVAVFFGLISYPLYLWHWPLFSLFNVVSTEINFSATEIRLARISIVLISIALSFLTWQYLEKPIQRLTISRATTVGGRRNALVTYLFALLGVAFVGLITIEADGMSFRHSSVDPANINRILAEASRDELLQYRKRSARCHGQFEEAQHLSWCYQSGDGESKFAVFGDSHAQALFPGIVKAMDGVPGLVIGQGGCPPLASVIRFDAGPPAKNACLEENLIALRLINPPTSKRSSWSAEDLSFLTVKGSATSKRTPTGLLSPRRNWAQTRTTRQKFSKRAISERLIACLLQARRWFL